MLCNIQIYFCNIMIKHLKHTFETTETLENICLKHTYIVIVTYATSQIDFCNIQMKHFKHKSETHKTRRRRRPWPTWWGTTVGMGRPQPGLGRRVHGVAQGYELILSSPSCSHVVTRLFAHCADSLLRHFDALFAMSYATLPKKMDRKARKMQHLVATKVHMCHELEQPAWAQAPAALRHGAVGPSAHVAWPGRGRKWSASRVVMWIRRSHVANKKNGADELKVGADLWVGQQAQLGASGREARGGVLALFLLFCFPMIFFP
jgi:hypothetical protein